MNLGIRVDGVHAERGKESVRALISLYAGHDLNHLAQIERLLAERGAAAAFTPAPNPGFPLSGT